MGKRRLAPRSSRAVAAIVAAVLAVALAAAFARGPISRHRLQNQVSTDAEMRYPGAHLTERRWQDEHHEKFVDTGGYDERAGWTYQYGLDRSIELDELFEFYESALGAKGWHVLRRDGSPSAPWSNPGGLHLARGRPDAGETLRVLVALPLEDHARGGRRVSRYSVEYRLPYQHPAPYG